MKWKGKMAKIEREQGNTGKWGSGKILPYALVDYQFKKMPIKKLQGIRGFSQEQGKM